MTNWEEQVNVFKIAKEKAPNGKIDVVIANAGIYGPDALDGLCFPNSPSGRISRQVVSDETLQVLTTLSQRSPPQSFLTLTSLE